MTLKHRFIRFFTILLTTAIAGSVTFYSVMLVHNTEDPHYAKKIALVAMALILLSIITGGSILFYLKGKEDANIAA